MQISGTGVSAGANSSTARASLRADFSMHHLRAAAQAAREAHEVERSNPPQHGEWFHDMLRLVPVSIVMAGAALEANANEIVQDILDATGKAAGLEITNGQRQLLRDWKEDRSGNSLANYRRLAHLLDKDPQTGDAVWEPARHLVEFRNLFMHFKPAWSHEDVHDRGLVKALKQRIPIAPGYQPPSAFRFRMGS